MFKKKMPKIILAGCSGCASAVLDKKQDGEITKVVLTHKSFADAYPDEMPADNFTLQKQIEAGVKLTEVNSVVIADDVNDVDLPEVDKQVEPSKTE